ncbi:hypothetical protein EHO61_14410 [Leptospira fluminis]|uniref:Lipoprotein n=1 Tax=Leptospira fluminis TaxID=2484979 RepID=A0A4R9GNH6_9LEPT|nr:hypothetical protein [Leptospira fluminis]TGK15709.1 hypothetical protein EHO61_14410 [Leptospira fluminis]
MKSIFLKTLILALAIGLSACAKHGKTNETDNSGILAAILAAPSGDSTKSVLRITQVDATSWSGICYDSFIIENSGVSASGTDFFNATLGALQNAPPLVRETVSKSTCSSLGFAGGVLQRGTGNNFNYKLYECNPDVGVCTFAAIQAAGF